MSLKIATTSICKNELGFVEKFYNALKDEVDYITILDTGSTDGTLEKLKEISEKDPRLIFDQKIIDPWRFDVARNEAFKLMPEDTDIFISIDLDEVFEPGVGDTIRDNWTDKALQIQYKYVWNHDANGNPLHTFDYNKICKNDGKWYWKYPVHELLQREDGIRPTGEAYIDLFGKITLHHWQTSESRGSYLKLLKLRYKEFPNEVMSIIYLGREYFLKGFYNEALSTLYKLKEPDEDTNISTIAYGYFLIGKSHYYLENWNKSIEWFKKSMNLDPVYREPYVGLAHVYADTGHPAEALCYLKRALRNTYRRYNWIEVSDIFGSNFYNFLAAMAFNSGDKKSAMAYICKARSTEYTNPEIDGNYNIIMSNTNDFELSL